MITDHRNISLEIKGIRGELQLWQDLRGETSKRKNETEKEYHELAVKKIDGLAKDLKEALAHQEKMRLP